MAASASSPSVAVVTLYPARLNAASIRPSLSGLSSTTKMLDFDSIKRDYWTVIVLRPYALHGTVRCFGLIRSYLLLALASRQKDSIERVNKLEKTLCVFPQNHRGN